jgi:glycosyltransferase involved in cell wall biosynthesis
MPVQSLPFVSICTPTRDRLAFLPLLLRCIEQQTYPSSLIEWVVIDDGLNSAEAICKRYPNTRYVRLDSAQGNVPVGRMRNLTHQNASGEILVYMDDDDYYPPRRIAHAVEVLQACPDRLIAGSSVLPVCFMDRHQKIWVFGPYGPNHATAGTFAFRRALLEKAAYEEKAKCSEECYFLKSYSVPMAQLDPWQTILSMSHTSNTFDKRRLIDAPPCPKIRKSEKLWDQVVADPELRAGYLAACSCGA